MERMFHTQFYRLEPKVSMADLSRISQKGGETTDDYLVRFKRVRNKCRVTLLEEEFVWLAQNGLDIELRKKFEGMEFRDYYEMSANVALYENLLKEEANWRSSFYGTYYQEPSFELGITKIVFDRPVECLLLSKASLRHPVNQEAI